MLNTVPHRIAALGRSRPPPDPSTCHACGGRLEALSEDAHPRCRVWACSVCGHRIHRIKRETLDILRTDRGRRQP